MQARDAYDDYPLVTGTLPHTAPEQLVLTSLLFGGPGPDPRRTRYLDVGCGTGHNVVALAFYRPEAEFVAIDRSAVQIERARALAAELGVANVRFEHTELARLSDEAWGRFDAIVAHGVFSWIAPEQRRALLHAVEQRLDDDGLFYVSYNAMPGWGGRGMIREAIRRVTEEVSTLPEKVEAARAWAAFVVRQYEGRDHAYADFMKRELTRFDAQGDAYLVHEYLAEHNQAFWFRDVASMLREHGLSYVAEAGFHDPSYVVPDAVDEAVASFAKDALVAEELIDVVRYAQMRASLFAKRSAAEPVGTGVVDRASVACALAPAEGDVRIDATPQTFVGQGGYTLTVHDPLLKACLATLASVYPRGARFEHLASIAERMLAESAPQARVTNEQREAAKAWMHELHCDGQASLRLVDPLEGPPATPAGIAANPLVRFEAAAGMALTTPTHERLRLDPGGGAIVAALDGARSPAEVAAAQPGVTATAVGELSSLLAAWGLLGAPG